MKTYRNNLLTLSLLIACCLLTMACASSAHHQDLRGNTASHRSGKPETDKRAIRNDEVLKTQAEDETEAVNTTPHEATNDKVSTSAKTSARYAAPVLLARIDDKLIDESSGVAASRRTQGVFWTHNDSGGGARLFAFDEQGNARGVWTVAGAKNRDWEDIAAAADASGTPQLYIADIGDNILRRQELVIYRITEPDVTANKTAPTNGKDATRNRESSNAKEELPATELAEKIRVAYPDGAHDAETLLVHPVTRDLYIVTKTFAAQAGVYRLAASDVEYAVSKGALVTLERIARISLPGMFGTLVTGGDISSDGRRVVLCDYAQGYELTLPANLNPAKDFDRIWTQPIAAVNIGNRTQGEAVAYTLNAKALVSTSENRPMTVYRIPAR